MYYVFNYYPVLVLSVFIAEPEQAPHKFDCITCVYISIYAWMITYRKFQMSRFMKIDIMKHVKASGGLLSEYSVGDLERRRLKSVWQFNSGLCFLRQRQAPKSQVVQM